MNFTDAMNVANDHVTRLRADARGRAVAAALRTLTSKPLCYFCRNRAKLVCTVEWEPPQADVTEFVSVCVCSVCAKRLRADSGESALRKYIEQGPTGCAVSVLKNTSFIVADTGTEGRPHERP